MDGDEVMLRLTAGVSGLDTATLYCSKILKPDPEGIYTALM
jgi:hypothetical protein